MAASLSCLSGCHWAVPVWELHKVMLVWSGDKIWASETTRSPGRPGWHRPGASEKLARSFSVWAGLLCIIYVWQKVVLGCILHCFRRADLEQGCSLLVGVGVLSNHLQHFLYFPLCEVVYCCVWPHVCWQNQVAIFWLSKKHCDSEIIICVIYVTSHAAADDLKFTLGLVLVSCGLSPSAGWLPQLHTSAGVPGRRARICVWHLRLRPSVCFLGEFVFSYCACQMTQMSLCIPSHLLLRYYCSMPYFCL